MSDDNAEKLVQSKEMLQTEGVGPRKIKQIQFGLQTPQEIVKCGTFHVHERYLYKMPERVPYRNGVLDRRLGTTSKTAVCETCGLKLAECAGHFGYIKLELPVFHIGYFKNTIQLLQCICKSCSRVLLKESDRQLWLRRFRSPRVERVQREGMFRKVNDMCRRQKHCPHCGAFNGNVKKTSGNLKIVHERYDAKKNAQQTEEFKAGFQTAVQKNEALRPHLNKLADDLNPLRAQVLFEAVPAEDLGVLDLVGRPEHLLVTCVSVPPMAIRPSVEMDGASNEDDITMKLMQIVEVNGVLRQGLEKGLPISNLMESWDFLQHQCACLINSDMPGLPVQHQPPGRPLRGFVQRLKGKQGRFRGNLSGKRVDFSGRTVISPDPNLSVDQVCVPQHMAVVLTYPERVTIHNQDKLRMRVMNGTNSWPGANFVILPDGSNKTYLKFGDRRKIAAELKVGYTVERHLEDGDIVLFNRQPSLHRISIMAFRAKIRPYRTLRFNECACSPFNADFDGDEMNLHVPQTEEARAEALHLMGSVSNLCTPKNGEIMISATQDFLTCAHLVTSKDAFFTRAELCLLIAYMSDACEQVDLVAPTIIKPIELWTGKQLFSMLVRPNRATRIFVNLEVKEKTYSGKNEHMCVKDGFVCFRNSDLICGRLGKGVLGGNKGGLFGVLHHDYNSRAAAACMGRLSKLAARHMGNRGFTIGIDDVTPRQHLREAKAKAIDHGYKECSRFIQEFAKGTMQLESGCDMDQSLEQNVTGKLNNVREEAGRVCVETLHWHNSPLIMSNCGSKGSPINIAQMVACVGQQSVSGKRCFNGFRDRTLPHYPRGDRTPAGKGFVANSFYSGLTATEFWFHTMGGREGLVDTAVKTAETGYMSRRLMKALEDLYTHYDKTVRNAAGGIVQFVYGDDGMDPVTMEGSSGSAFDFSRAAMKVRATTRRLRAADGGRTEVQLPDALQAAVDEHLRRPLLDPRSEHCSARFSAELAGFLRKQVANYREARRRLKLPADARGDEAVEYLAGQEGLTPAQLNALVERAVQKYEVKRIDPGSTVGAVGAQSIGEPGTQMTLKTFHFAGVASMNVTLGVPRIKEIINAAKKISTPIMHVYLENDDKVENARVIKGRVERTVLGQISSRIKIILKPGSSGGRKGGGTASISVTLDMEALEALKLQLNAWDVGQSILAHPRIKLKEQHVRVESSDKLYVDPPEGPAEDMLFTLDSLLATLPKVIVRGISTVERAVIHKEKDKENNNRDSFKLLVEGTNLQSVMATQGVVGAKCITNHIHEVEKYLGIEAARSSIMREINYTMDQHGMTIDNRHTMLLADCMTYKGEVLGITRFGIAKMKDSVLHTASFEKTADHLFDAAIHGRCDDVVGVSESIIMGIPMPTGTGLFKLRQNVGQVDPQDLPQRPPPVLLSYS